MHNEAKRACQQTYEGKRVKKHQRERLEGHRKKRQHEEEKEEEEEEEEEEEASNAEMERLGGVEVKSKIFHKTTAKPKSASVVAVVSGKEKRGANGNVSNVHTHTNDQRGETRDTKQKMKTK